jgi:hypothetical protein
MDEIAMGPVDFDGIKTQRNGPLGCPCKIQDGFLYLPDS